MNIGKNVLYTKIHFIDFLNVFSIYIFFLENTFWHYTRRYKIYFLNFLYSSQNVIINYKSNNNLKSQYFNDLSSSEGLNLFDKSHNSSRAWYIKSIRLNT